MTVVLPLAEPAPRVQQGGELVEAGLEDDRRVRVQELQHGAVGQLPPLRQPWILGRDDVEPGAGGR